jgi:hypothetical protein
MAHWLRISRATSAETESISFSDPSEEGDSSGLVRERLQVMPGTPRLVAAEEEADGVDDRALHLLNAMNCVLQS